MDETKHPAQYPLGTDQQEFERLHLQHQLWSDAAHGLWKLGGVRPGAHVLDVGAGPGAATFDLAHLVTMQGRVLAVDESESFVRHIEREASRRGLSQIAAAVGDVQRLDAISEAKDSSFDLAYARWVLCFTARPDDVVRRVAACLKPGGAFCVHDYFNYTVMTPAPRRASYTGMVQATARSWRDRGGDPDVVARLPQLFHDSGLDLVHLVAHQRVARPGDAMWYWASTWWRSYAPRLVSMGYLTDDDVQQFWRDVDAMTPEADYLVMPPVFELLARKR